MKGSESGCPGVVISAPQGRSGKTIATLALCTTLRRRGLTVQPFKKGPDYVDPSWLTEAAGRPCHNLDHYLMTEKQIMALFKEACQDADIAVVEGAMGLYDGPETAGWGSTAHLARRLHMPIVLVIDCTRMTGSIAAMISGYQHFQPALVFSGIILNNVSGERHERKLRKAVQDHCRLPVIGAIYRDPDLSMTQRHLGHIPFPEQTDGQSIIERISALVEPHLSPDTILAMVKPGNCNARSKSQTDDGHAKKIRIGVMYDRVFNFYYPENLQALERAGARLVLIDSLADRLPAVDGLYIGGGFPEFFLEGLEANRGMRSDIAGAVEKGLPLYAECGGLMYLCRQIQWQNRQYEMVGTIPAHVEITERPQGHGYVDALINRENPWFRVGTKLKGHEFHHSRLVTNETLDCIYSIKRGHGLGNGMDGIIYKNVLAAYTHLHALGTYQWAEAFVSLAQRERDPHYLVSISVN